MPAAIAGFITESFDMYNGTGVASSSAVGMGSRWNVFGSQTLVAGRFGGQAFQSTSQNNSGAYLGITQYSALTVGVAINTSNGGGYQCFGLAYNQVSSPTMNVAVALNGSGGASISYGGGSMASATGLFNLGAWNYWELSVTHGTGTSGSAALYLNGVQVINAPSINTEQNGGISNYFVFGNSGTNMLNSSFDDWYLNPSATPLGPMRIACLYPTSNGTVAWTPLTGSNYSEANEAHVDADTSYNSASNVGTSDLYNFGALPSTPATIYGVSPVCFARSTDANPRSLNLQLQSGPTNELGANISYGATSYIRQQRMDLVDPNTSAGWTQSAVNALQGGPYVAI